MKKEEASQNAKERFHKARAILEAARQDESFEPYVDWEPDSDIKLEKDEQ